MPETKIDAAFERFKSESQPEALAYVFDQTAAELLRVASHLCRDVHVAEDLVQTTFLVAIERCDDHPVNTPILPWLVGILTNRARERRRQDDRTVDASRLAPREIADPAAAAEATELSDAMIAAIGGLPPAYQPVLNLHLRHDFSPGEIAETLVRPPGTVRTQLVRGMDLLRAALPIGLAGAVAGLVVPSHALAAMRSRVLKAAPKVGSITVAGWTLGAVWMSKKIVVGMAIVAMLVVAGFVWSSNSANPTLMPTEDASSTVHVTPPSADDAKDAEHNTIAERTKLPPTTPGTETPLTALATVRGRCVDPRDRSPLAGCTVTVEWKTEIGERIEPSSTAVSHEDGRFAFPLVEGTARVTVRCKTDGRAVAQTYGMIVASGGLDVGDMALPTICQVSGLVLDESGNPVEGLSVGAFDMANAFLQAGQSGHPTTNPSVTDRGGQFALSLYAASKWQLSVNKHRDVLKGQSLSITHDQSRAQVELRVGPVKRPEAVSGIVVDEQGHAVSAAIISSPFPGKTLITDESGHFSFARQPRPGMQTQGVVHAEKDGYLPASAPFEWGDTDLRLTLSKGLMIDLLVTDATSGRPVSEYGVRMMRDPLLKSPNGSNASVERWNSTQHSGSHAEGRCRIGPLTPGWAFIEIEPADPSYDPFVVNFSATETAITGLTVQLYRQVSRRVRIVDRLGKGIESCEASLVRALRDYPVTQWTRILKPNHMERLAHAALDPSLSHTSKLLQELTQAMTVSKTRSDASGETKITTAPAGRLALRLTHPDYVPVTIDDLNIEASEALIVTMSQVASLELRVIPEDFRTHLQPGASHGFYLESGDSEPASHPVFLRKLPKLIQPNAKGVLRIDNIPPGTWNIVLEQRIPFLLMQGTAKSVVGELVAIKSGEKRAQTIDISAWLPGEVQGLVLLDGKPVAAEVVTLGRDLRVLTDASGRFSMRLPPGNYDMKVRTKQGEFFADRALAVSTKQTIERRFEFTSRKIEFRVLDAAGEPAPKVRLSFTHPRFSMSSFLQTDSEGKATLKGGPNGDVTVGCFRVYSQLPISPTTITLNAEAANQGIEIRIAQ